MSIGDASALAAVAQRLASTQRALGSAYHAAVAAAAAVRATPASLWVPMSDMEAMHCEVLPRLAKRADALAQALHDITLLQVRTVMCRRCTTQHTCVQVALEEEEVDRSLLAKLLPSQWRVFAARHPMHAVRTRRVGALLGEQQAQYFRRPFI